MPRGAVDKKAPFPSADGYSQKLEPRVVMTRSDADHDAVVRRCRARGAVELKPGDLGVRDAGGGEDLEVREAN